MPWRLIAIFYVAHRKAASVYSKIAREFEYAIGLIDI